MTGITFETVSACFDRVYDELREVNGENAPDSYTWYARTREELEEELSVPSALTSPLTSEHAVTLRLGDVDSPVVAWVFGLQNSTLAAIHERAIEHRVTELFGQLAGFEGI